MVEKNNLISVADVQYGYPFESSLFTEDENFIPLIRIRDVKPGLPSTYYSGEYSSEYIIRKGDILVGMDGEFNLAKWKSRDGLLNQRVLKLSGKNNICNSGYLYHYMGPVFKKIELQTAGGSVKHLSAKVINKIQIPIPSLDEQNRIVGILDTFTESIENIKKQIQLRKKQYEFYRDQLLDLEGKPGVEMKTIKQILSQPITDGPHETPKFISDGIPFISADAIVNNRIDFSRKRGFISEEYDNLCRKKYKPHLHDVYVVKSGSTTGKVAIVTNLIRFNIWSPLAALRVDENNNAFFVYYWFQTKKAQDQIKLKCSKGSQPNLSMRVLEKFFIPVPSLSEQSRIVSILDQFESSISNLEQQLSQRQKQYEYYRNKLLTFE